MTDLDDTRRCPCGPRCEACGLESTDVRVATADTALGVLCMTMCPRCSASSVAPPIAVGTAARLVMQHALHLGITADDMEALCADRAPWQRPTYRVLE